MSGQYGIPIGKKSQTVKRKAFSSGFADCDFEPTENSKDTKEEFHSERHQATFDGSSPYTAANIRTPRHLEPYRQESFSGKLCPTQRSLFSLDSLPCDDLPHPNKLSKKRTNNKRTNVSSRLLEKHLYVENHRNQLRQRAQKYKNCTETKPLQEKHLSELQEEEGANIEGISSQTLQATIPMERTPMPLSEYNLPPFPSSVVKRPRPSLYPPGGVFSGSASLEELEEERWFRQLWKSKTKQRPSEE